MRYKSMPAKNAPAAIHNRLLGVLFAGDLVVCFAGMCLGYWVRFDSSMRHFGVIHAPTWSKYSPLLLFGTLLLVITYSYLKLYDPLLLLRPARAGYIILRGTVFWVLFFLSVSLIVKFDPPISRLFVAVSCGTTFLSMMLWRRLFFLVVSRSDARRFLVQRVGIIGWNAEAAQLAQAVLTDSNHPYDIAGVILSQDELGAPRDYLGRPPLGSISDLERIINQEQIAIVVAADLEMKREQLLQISAICERSYVAFKVIPTYFQIFVSNLRMQTISGVPILGVEALAIRSIPNQFIKRSLDCIGALVGLAGAVPTMLVLAFLIRRESPGPVVHRQVRTGRHGRPFTIYKLRSMRMDAERDSGPRWAVEDDPRRLKIGAFMREWNLDELPQFWNVLKGDMSLVGPRPERPELIAQFEREIPHYNPRHEMRPGMTGWAQVNGLRGNTSLVERIRYDLYYIENWTIWFDIQILVLTFLKRKNAY
jgi:exopolysaccharide biosynthesis polyprenyl glycosylphosphotransferase